MGVDAMVTEGAGGEEGRSGRGFEGWHKFRNVLLGIPLLDYLRELRPE